MLSIVKNNKPLFIEHLKIALWSESIYFRGYDPVSFKPIAERDIEKFVNTLNENGVTDVFIFAGPFQADGHLPYYPFSDVAIQSLRTIKAKAPNVKILPWVGGIQNKTVFLEDSLWVKNAIADIQKLVQKLELKGVHIDFESILGKEAILYKGINPRHTDGSRDYTNNFNQFCKQLRKNMPEDFISAVICPDLEHTNPWKAKSSFTSMCELGKYIDQLCLLYHDTDIHSNDLFRQDCMQLLRHIRILKNDYPKLECFITIGTFINHGSLQHYHDPGIENIRNITSIISSCLQEAKFQPNLLSGFAIYCNWQTDASEWSQIRNITSINR